MDQDCHDGGREKREEKGENDIGSYKRLLELLKETLVLSTLFGCPRSILTLLAFFELILLTLELFLHFAMTGIELERLK
jgi:hypothetical protein